MFFYVARLASERGMFFVRRVITILLNHSFSNRDEDPSVRCFTTLSSNVHKAKSLPSLFK
jgi:hypothetical protein